ncbi:unnamed protein product [Rangifer tarandus platyrhynchus]|uniref:PPIase cyclophilin-type domain-containing protein n=1 Tax=Rangifer tarandus platyrhynchus TaxID=3082113 RepID=A0ABN8XJE7_RANTA|nr:unnamed protein product [Rangifer tarandus platyrhynchus]
MLQQSARSTVGCSLAPVTCSEVRYPAASQLDLQTGGACQSLSSLDTFQQLRHSSDDKHLCIRALSMCVQVISLMGAARTAASGDPYQRRKNLRSSTTALVRVATASRLHPSTALCETGILGMCKSRKGGSSQFYVTLRPYPQFDGFLVAIGKAVSGMQELIRFAQEGVPCDVNQRPLEDCFTIQSVEVISA